MASNAEPAIDQPEIATELAETSAFVHQVFLRVRHFRLFAFLVISSHIRTKSMSKATT